MKGFLVKTIVWILKILYAPMKLRRTKKKIVWLSRQSSDMSLDIRMLSQTIYDFRPDVEQVFRLRRLRGEHDISLSYGFSLIKDMWELASAQIAVTDTYSIPLSCLKHKKGLEIIQIWHALGAVKKFGLQSVGTPQGRDARIAEWMSMHKNYDHIIAPSKAASAYYSEAFGCDPERIVIASLPRVDVILDGSSQKEAFLELNPQFVGKKLFVYLPTFRKNDIQYAEQLSDTFAHSEDTALIISLHPLSRKKASNRFGFNGNFTTYDLMKLADGIITDYSACSFEGALLNKPILFFIPDFDAYSVEQGINTDITLEMPSACFTDPRKLYEAVSDRYDFGALSAFADKYVEHKGIDNTEKLSKWICSFIKD